MRYIFYADVYFIQNFMIKVAVLYLALYCNKIHFEITRTKGIVRICLASGIGTIIEILGLLFGGFYHIFAAGVHLFEVPLMVWYVVGKERRRIFRLILSGYLFTVLINGVLEALWNQFGENGSYIFYLFFSCGVVIAGVHIWSSYTKMQKGIFAVELRNKGKSMRIKGFYDSGNRLTDPYTGKGVHIISEKQISLLSVNGITGDEIHGPVYVPYQALGKEDGMLEVYYMDELMIEGEKGRKILQKCPVGVTKDNLFEGKNYEIILNEEVF